MTKSEILRWIRQGLIVSCQALPNEPLHGADVMARMAIAAKQGGAAGIRANTPADIAAIKAAVDLPVIGIYKKEYADSEIYITPTIEEVDSVAAAGAEIIAVDATARLRPNGVGLAAFLAEARKRHPHALFMADCSTAEEATIAAGMDFDMVATTLAGYTPYTRNAVLPNLDMVRALQGKIDTPIIAEGGIHSPSQAAEALQAGAFAVVVGGAITRPQEIAARFAASLKAASKE